MGIDSCIFSAVGSLLSALAHGSLGSLIFFSRYSSFRKLLAVYLTRGPHKLCNHANSFKENDYRNTEAFLPINVKMWEILRGIFIFKFQINVSLPQSLCFVIIVPLNGEYWRFPGFCDVMFHSLHYFLGLLIQFVWVPCGCMCNRRLVLF